MKKYCKYDEIHESREGLAHDQERTSCSVHCSGRYTIVVSNGVLCLAAVIVTSLAMFSLVVEGSFFEGSSVEYITLTLAVSIIFSGIATLLSCSVIFLALNHKRLVNLYNTFRTIFIGAVISEIAIFIIGMGYLPQIEELTNSIVEWNLFIRYYQEEYIRNDLDVIQRELKCCGFKSYKDWDLNPYYSCNSTGYSRCSVPFSCCKIKNADTSCVLGIRDPKVTEAKLRESIYLDGCLKTSQMWYEYTLVILTSAAVWMAVLQVLFVITLARYVKNENERKNARKRCRIRKSRSIPEDERDSECPSLSKHDTMIVKHVNKAKVISSVPSFDKEFSWPFYKVVIFILSFCRRKFAKLSDAEISVA